MHSCASAPEVQYPVNVLPSAASIIAFWAYLHVTPQAAFSAAPPAGGPAPETHAYDAGPLGSRARGHSGLKIESHGKGRSEYITFAQNP